MIFEFKTTSGASVSSTNTALGTVILTTQYNPNDLPFSTKVEMENYEFGTSGAPFENFLHPVECKPALTVAPQLYVQQPVLPFTTNDPKLTTFGVLTLATVGMQAANVVGELWCSYQIELLKPRLSTAIDGPGYLKLSTTSGMTSNSPVSPLGTAPAVTIVNQLDGSPGPFSNFVVDNGVNSLLTASCYYTTGVGNSFKFLPSTFANRTIMLSIFYTGTTFSTNQALINVGPVNSATVTTLQQTSSATTNCFNWLVQFGDATTLGAVSVFNLQLTTPTAATLTIGEATLSLVR